MGFRCLFGREQIKTLIAHRAPMLYLDRVTVNQIGLHLVAQSDFFPPDRLRQLESLGQASALLIRQTPAYRDRPLPVFVGMKRVIWDKLPEEANFVEYHVKFSEKKKSRARLGFVDALAIADGTKLCSAELSFSFLHDEQSQ